MSPVVQGTAKMLEAETLDMNRYREQKDKLEYEAMMRNPETAYLVSNEEFDKQLEELGWSPGDMVTMAGMYIERGMYNMKKGIRDFFREILELMFQAAALVIDTIRTFFLEGQRGKLKGFPPSVEDGRIKVSVFHVLDHTAEGVVEVESCGFSAGSGRKTAVDGSAVT